MSEDTSLLYFSINKMSDTEHEEFINIALHCVIFRFSLIFVLHFIFVVTNVNYLCDRNCRKHWILVQLTAGGDERSLHRLRQLTWGCQTGTEVRGSFQKMIYIWTEYDKLIMKCFHPSVHALFSLGAEMHGPPWNQMQWRIQSFCQKELWVKVWKCSQTR